MAGRPRRRRPSRPAGRNLRSSQPTQAPRRAAVPSIGGYRFHAAASRASTSATRGGTACWGSPHRHRQDVPPRGRRDAVQQGAQPGEGVVGQAVELRIGHRHPRLAAGPISEPGADRATVETGGAYPPPCRPASGACLGESRKTKGLARTAKAIDQNCCCSVTAGPRALSRPGGPPAVRTSPGRLPPAVIGGGEALGDHAVGHVRAVRPGHPGDPRGRRRCRSGCPVSTTGPAPRSSDEPLRRQGRGSRLGLAVAARFGGGYRCRRAGPASRPSGRARYAPARRPYRRRRRPPKSAATGPASRSAAAAGAPAGPRSPPQRPSATARAAGRPGRRQARTGIGRRRPDRARDSALNRERSIASV